ncbi:hypothetical protein [Aliiroseovarius sp. 2305UL8-7]|uniref:hypothetical protein n=1 Tax=Aliiroseovarius conchicola TaxID=3121637 RepID=UPI003528844D
MLLSDDPDTRVYEPSKLLPLEVIQAVFDEFRRDVPVIFGENLSFGFCMGGFAKGYAVNNQDADFFVCLRHKRRAEVEVFHKWYFDLHERYELVPDIKDPGEIMSEPELFEKLSFVSSRVLRDTIESYFEYEAIVWADIISGAKAAVIGHLDKLNEYEVMCELLPQRWRMELFEMIGDDLDIETAKLPISRLFKRAINYQKKDILFKNL